MGNTEARPPGRPPKETAEYRAEAVRLVEEGGQSLRQVARDLGLSVETLRREDPLRLHQGGGRDDCKPCVCKQELHEIAQLRAVVDHQYGGWEQD
jgi:transposase-like protein